MNKIISKFFVIIVFSINTFHGLDYRKAILVKHAIIPVLYVNDYVVRASSGYEALIKEVCLSETFFTKSAVSSSPYIHKDCYTMSAYQYPKYPENMYGALENSNAYTIFTEKDMEYVQKKVPENIRICINNVLCGASMLSILFVLTFCR